jgi:hypothetical protein
MKSLEFKDSGLCERKTKMLTTTKIRIVAIRAIGYAHQGTLLERTPTAMRMTTTNVRKNSPTVHIPALAEARGWEEVGEVNRLGKTLSSVSKKRRRRPGSRGIDLLSLWRYIDAPCFSARR